MAGTAGLFCRCDCIYADELNWIPYYAHGPGRGTLFSREHHLLKRKKIGLNLLPGFFLIKDAADY